METDKRNTEIKITYEGKYEDLGEYIEELVNDILEDLPKHSAIKTILSIMNNGKNIETEYTLDRDRSELLQAEAGWFTSFYLLHGLNVKEGIADTDTISVKITIKEV